MNRDHWSAEEIEILKSIWASNNHIEHQIHLLPSRTVKAAQHQAARLGLVKAYSGVLRRYHALAIIREHGPISVVALAERLSTSRQNADSLIFQLRSEKRIYVKGHEDAKQARARTMKLWAAGNCSNALMPKRKRVSKRKPEPVIVKTVQIPTRCALTEAFYGRAA